MKAKKKLLFIPLFLGLMVYINTTTFIKESNLEEKFQLNNLFTMAYASSESCTGDDQPFDKVESTGILCTCNDQLVFKQRCVPSGSGCTPINCGS